MLSGEGGVVGVELFSHNDHNDHDESRSQQEKSDIESSVKDSPPGPLSTRKLAERGRLVPPLYKKESNNSIRSQYFSFL